MSCEHEWFRPLAEVNPNLYHLLKCKKCGLNAVEYKCNVCGRRTPHEYVAYVGEAKKKATDLLDVGYLEEWRCLVCGCLKTVRKGGSFARIR